MKSLLNRLKEECDPQDILLKVIEKCFNIQNAERMLIGMSAVNEIPHLYYEYSFKEKEIPFSVNKYGVEYDLKEFKEHLKEVYRISVQIGPIRRCLSTKGVREWNGRKWVVITKKTGE